MEISHFSDDELLYDNDLISGTMEGLVDWNMFDMEQPPSDPAESTKRQKISEEPFVEANSPD